MTNIENLFVGFVVSLSLAGCGGTSRLSDSEIDRACELAARCTGVGASCTRAVIDARALADRNGCAAEFARTNRCLISDDMCSVSARCQY
jgi:hypothetical protein